MTSQPGSIWIKCCIRVEDGLGVVDLAGGGGQNPAVVNWADDWRNNPNQQWYVSLVPGSENKVNIANVREGRLIIGDGHDKRARAEFVSKSDTSAQWYLEGSNLRTHNQDDKVRFRNVAYDKTYLDLAGGGKYNGNAFITYTGNGGSNQLFKMLK